MICLKVVSGAAVVNTHVSVHKAVKEKATKYKELDLPYIVAVNIIDPFASQDDLLSALFGEKQITLSLLRAQASWVQRESRARNGAWFGPLGPHNTRVSAVLAGFNLTPIVIATRSPEMIHNPWASLPLHSDLWPLAQILPNLEEDCLDNIPGKTPTDLMVFPE